MLDSTYYEETLSADNDFPEDTALMTIQSVLGNDVTVCVLIIIIIV